MRKSPFLKTLLILSLLCIFIPMLLIGLWSFVARWPWPDLTPAKYSLRTFNDLIFRSKKLTALLGSSFSLAAATALISTLIGIIFGLLPAMKAANLNPIDALRRV